MSEQGGSIPLLDEEDEVEDPELDPQSIFIAPDGHDLRHIVGIGDSASKLKAKNQVV